MPSSTTASPKASAVAVGVESTPTTSSTQKPELIDEAKDYFQANPGQFGWLPLVLGVVLLIGTFLKWGWVFEGGGGRLNLAWIANTFGFRAAQVVSALLALAFVGVGVAMLTLYGGWNAL
ncbi:MAG: hypothetical protein BGO98_00355 [Myxococcales bacterium 68-20]|nr:MAG: hypothetical protein BGO98_00355 [Myxococcales bacterium 68-20]